MQWPLFVKEELQQGAHQREGVKAFFSLIGGARRKGLQYFYTGMCDIKVAPETHNKSAQLPLKFSFTSSPLTFSSDPPSACFPFLPLVFVPSALPFYCPKSVSRFLANFCCHCGFTELFIFSGPSVLPVHPNLNFPLWLCMCVDFCFVWAGFDATNHVILATDICVS